MWVQYQCESSNSHMSWVTSANNRRKSGMGMPGKRLLPRDCSSTTGNRQRIPEEPMLDGDMSHFNIGYWDGLGVYKVMNVEGSDEVVEITYDIEDKEPSNRKGEDDLSDEMGTESFAVWYRSPN